MKEYNLEDTIAAIATPFGQGAISIIRLSGEKAFEIFSKIFSSEKNFDQADNWRAIFGKVVDGEKVVDEVIAVKYKSPHSYTREDLVEINCHGGIYVTQRILDLLMQSGARLAQPGEFTLRAFLNGRIDLSQAEAVSDLIQSQTEVSLQSSLRQLQGSLSRKINSIRDELIQSCSLLELELDFAEEDVEFVKREDFIRRIEEISSEFEELIESFQVGRIAREGVKVVITGKPNVGKSSLLNVLAKEEKAIVTDIPGTTRDALEVRLDIKGILFRIYDTAGIKSDSSDLVEQEGIRRSKQLIGQADVVVQVFDGSQALSAEDFEILNHIRAQAVPCVLMVINKCDLEQKLEKKILFEHNSEIIEISALQKIGISDFELKLLQTINRFGNFFASQAQITNFRHFEVLKRAMESLTSAKEELQRGVSSEYVSLYLREALDYLGEITGKVTSEDILNNIFSQFCIGK